MNKNYKIILVGSIALNLLLIGFGLGHALGSFKPMPMPPYHNSPFGPKEEKLVQALPADKQGEAREVLKTMAELRRNSFQTAKPLLEEVEKAVTAENFDDAKFLTSFASFDESMIAVKKESDVIVAKFLSKLTQEERKKLLEQVKADQHFSKGAPDFKEIPNAPDDSQGFDPRGRAENGFDDRHDDQNFRDKPDFRK